MKDTVLFNCSVVLYGCVSFVWKQGRSTSVEAVLPSMLVGTYGLELGGSGAVHDDDNNDNDGVNATLSADCGTAIPCATV